MRLLFVGLVVIALVLQCSTTSTEAYYWVNLSIETSPDEGNVDSTVYLELLGIKSGAKVVLSEKRWLGTFARGSVRYFSVKVLNGDPQEVQCLRFTLDGTDGWTMQKTTMVLSNNMIFEFKGGEKLDNTMPWSENHIDFCDRSERKFGVGSPERTPNAGVEGLLYFDKGTVCSRDFAERSANALCNYFGITSGEARWRTPTEPWMDNFRDRPPITLGSLHKCGDYLHECLFSTVLENCDYLDSVLLTCGLKKPLPTFVKVIIGVVVTIVTVIILAILYYKIIIKCGRDSGGASIAAAAQPVALSTEPMSVPSAPDPVSPSAPPAYDDINDTPEQHSDMPPSYDEAISFRRLSQYLRKSRH